MATDPNQMAQIMALYKKMFPNGVPNAQAQAYSQAQSPMQTAAGLGNAPAGTNVGAGGTNAMAKLVLALLARKRMQEYNLQYPQQGLPQQPQGVTMTGGGTGPGDQGMPGALPPP